MNRVLITGASGFVGRALVADLAAEGWSVRAAMRHPADLFGPQIDVIAVSDLTRPVEWRPLLKGVDAVIHLAGIAHSGPGIAEEQYDRVNRLATAELAAAAGAMGVRRLVFVSSIRAQSGSAADHVLTEADAARPTDAYGRSKLAAEDAVRAGDAPYTILRPVLIYGANVKGNLASLMSLARLPLPLPLASFRNRRSLLARENLASAIRLALAMPADERDTYIVADPDPVTIADIVAVLRAGFGRRPNLLPVPLPVVRSIMDALGRGDLWERLGGELVASPAKLLAKGWMPAVQTRDGLVAMAQAASPRKSGTASRSTR